VEIDDSGEAEALVRLASAVRREWLPSDQLREDVEVQFDAQREKIVAWKRVRIGDLVIDETETKIPADVDAGEILAREAAKRCNLQSLLDDDAEQFIARMKCLAQWMPELELPRWADDVLREILPDLCTARTSFAELRQAPLVPILRAKLTPRQLATLEQEAPAKLTVPSGSQIALQYEAGQPPILAVRIQEMFGLAATPRIARGRVPVLLHLLAPSHRPQQITSDLASFWRTTYPQVRNELRRRYPKHAWPDDPLSAKPQSRPSRKR
jgi:ATP-dependent helicase HrpB